MGFADDLRAFARGSEERANDVVRGAVMTLVTKIVMRSPVDTGRFRGNWQVTVGAPPLYSVDRLDKNGSPTISIAQAAIPEHPAGQVFYIANNVYYGVYLEQGWSPQAPGTAAIVGRSVMEFNQDVRRLLQDASR